jgi:thiosulfate/3-mercaptopyruvate sulfurtransferase
MVSTDWLHKNLNNPEIFLIDMSGEETQYQRFHIPGAVYLGYQNLVYKRNKKEKASFRVPADHLRKILGVIGLTNDKHVVIYDDMGGLNAGRLFWDLENIGHQKVSVVNGGLVKWILEGKSVNNQRVVHKPAVYHENEGAGRNNVVDIKEITHALGREDTTLLDVRTHDEYVGFKNYKRTGHIPGAHHWPWDESVAIENGFVLQDAARLEQTLKQVGVSDKQQSVMLYCRSGHRAAQSYLVMRHLGYNNVRLYDGSMAEYANKPDLPIKQGNQP